MFDRTQKLECLGPVETVNTSIEKAMCKVCLVTERREGQRNKHHQIMVLPLKGNQWAQRLDPLSPLPHSQPFIIVVVVFFAF